MDEVEVKHEVIEAPPAQETPADVDAARAAAAAETAQEAAALAIAQSEAATAEVAQIAATELQAYQERLETCERSYSAILAQVESSHQRLGELEAENLLIRQQLEASREASPPKSAEPVPSEDAPRLPESTEPKAGAPSAAPQEVEKPERRRAHRWI